ncbi:hypothetical protein DNTS_007256 [Danionella cerebrum]|uniref:Uncharacterized protein n=1 Tax=Danionella cerebrum TaxID=2873325 RepID=A0A553NRE8_9TELE|nr:hypothetical protein DNTS_007256 [Danionella translucida]
MGYSIFARKFHSHLWMETWLLIPAFSMFPFHSCSYDLVQVVYFGDSMRSDMFPACSFGKWETVMIVEEMEGEGVPRANSSSSSSSGGSVPNEGPAEKKAKFEDQGMKSPSAVSKQWGSYFVDVQKKDDLPLDFKFQRFSSEKPISVGFYPRPPDSLLNWEENLS